MLATIKLNISCFSTEIPLLSYFMFILTAKYSTIYIKSPDSTKPFVWLSVRHDTFLFQNIQFPFENCSFHHVGLLLLLELC